MLFGSKLVSTLGKNLIISLLYELVLKKATALPNKMFCYKDTGVWECGVRFANHERR